MSGRDVVSALGKIGYEYDRLRGSHNVLRLNREPYRRIVVPNHRQVAKGTLRAIIREAGLTVEEFRALM